MIGFDEALALTLSAAQPLGEENVPLARARGRTLARDICARIDSPRCAVSAMDGYAVRDSDCHDQAQWQVIGTSAAGQAFNGAVGPGQAVRIFTGAPVPHGADRVLVQEIISRTGDSATLSGAWGEPRHIRAQASDFAAGDTLLKQGSYLHARALVAAAASDRADVSVWRQPRVALLGTGDELAAPGTAHLSPYAIPESLSFGLGAFVEQWGGVIGGQMLCPDQPDKITAAAQSLLGTADLLVMTGGASVGERDYARSALEPLGLSLLFSKVAIKPGKPVWLGRVGPKLVLGLPGNPTSAMVTARLFLAPLLRGLAGGDPAQAVRWRTATLATDLPACGDRESFVRAHRLGRQVRHVHNQDSGAQRALLEADILIRQRAGTPALSVGGEVDILDF